MKNFAWVMGLLFGSAGAHTYPKSGHAAPLPSVQHFCSFGAMLFIVNLLIKTDSTVICVPCMLEHVSYDPFSF